VLKYHDQSGVMDLKLGSQLTIHCSDCRLLYSEISIKPVLTLSMRKKTQHFR